MSNRLEGGRTGLAILTVFALVMTLFAAFGGGTAFAEHIAATGPLPDNCVNFQAGETGTESPVSFPDVDITLDSWANTPGDPHTVNFTISGLLAGQFVDLSVKSGTTVQEPGPYGNGSHSYSNGLQNAISHIRLCVFGDPVTTTTQATTTTTQATTTTTQGTTTTTQGTTTTTQGTTTTTILGTTITAPTTTTTILGTTVTSPTSTLPFTGVESEQMVGIAIMLLGSGLLLTVAGIGRREET